MFQIPHIGDIIWYLSFSFRLSSLIMIIARSIHVAANGIILFFFRVEQYSIIYTYHSFFIHACVDRHLGYFHVLAIGNSAAVNTGANHFFEGEWKASPFKISLGCLLINFYTQREEEKGSAPGGLGSRCMEPCRVFDCVFFAFRGLQYSWSLKGRNGSKSSEMGFLVFLLTRKILPKALWKKMLCNAFFRKTNFQIKILMKGLAMCQSIEFSVGMENFQSHSFQ